MEKYLRIGLLLVALVVVGLIPVAGITADMSEAKDLFEKRCSLCHPTSRPLSKTKSSAEWQKTVNRMKDYAKGRISDKDAAVIIEYLTETRGK